MHLDHPTVSARYFFPRRAPLPSPLVVPVDGAELHCWHHPAPPGADTLLHFHGNGEVVADHVPDFAAGFVAAGLGVLLAEFRGYGGSTGSPSLVRMLDDGLAVLDQAGLEPARTLVYGRSVGSIYAVHVAAHRPVKALVLESGIASPLERVLMRAHPAELGCTGADLAEEAALHLDHEAKLKAYDGRVLVLHTLADHIVGFDNAERLASWSDGELVPLSPGDHNSILYFHQPQIVRRVVALSGA